jgi:hypothetical protein
VLIDRPHVTSLDAHDHVTQERFASEDDTFDYDLIACGAEMTGCGGVSFHVPDGRALSIAKPVADVIGS